jgi:TonB family protein
MRKTVAPLLLGLVWSLAGSVTVAAATEARFLFQGHLRANEQLPEAGASIGVSYQPGAQAPVQAEWLAGVLSRHLRGRDYRVVPAADADFVLVYDFGSRAATTAGEEERYVHYLGTSLVRAEEASAEQDPIWKGEARLAGTTSREPEDPRSLLATLASLTVWHFGLELEWSELEQPGALSTSVLPPVLVERVSATRPSAAPKLDASVTVTLQIAVRRDGTVGDVEVLECNHRDAGFEEAAVEAVRRWQYRPAIQRGFPDEIVQNVKIRFDPQD